MFLNILKEMQINSGEKIILCWTPAKDSVHLYELFSYLAYCKLIENRKFETVDYEKFALQIVLPINTLLI